MFRLPCKTLRAGENHLARAQSDSPSTVYRLLSTFGLLSTLFPLALVAISLCIAGCSQPPPPPSVPAGPSELIVFAAASTTEALEQIKVDFGRKKDARVRLNFGSSATLAAQIVEGAEADIFISASEEWAADLESRKLVAHRRNFLGNSLVAVVPADSKIKIDKPSDLASDEVIHLALADPESVPAGKYAKAALVKLGLWEKVEKKIVAGNDVRQALVYVERGEAEAGIVYATDATVTTKVKRAFTFDPVLTKPILYPLVILQPRGRNPAVREFYDYLGSPAASDVFEKHGFWIIPDSSKGP